MSTTSIFWCVFWGQLAGVGLTLLILWLVPCLR
jgi:hypothetical protein